MEITQELPVAGAPFVKALLEVAHDEDAPVFLRLFDDLADVALEHGELLGAGVLEFVEQPVLDRAVEAVGHLVLVERLRVREQGDVVAETQQARPAVLLVVGGLVIPEAAVQGLGLLESGADELVDRPPDQPAHGVGGFDGDVDLAAETDDARQAHRALKGGREELRELVGGAVITALARGGFSEGTAGFRVFVRRAELLQQESLHLGPIGRGVDGVGRARPGRLTAVPDQVSVAPDGRVRRTHQQAVVFLGHLGQRFQRVGDLLAVVVVLEVGQHRRRLGRFELLDDRLHGPQAQGVGLLVGDGRRRAAAQADFQGEVVHQLREEAVERAHRQAVRRQQRLSEHLAELRRPELPRVETQAGAELGPLAVVFGGLAQFADDLHDELRRRRAGERQGGDLLVLHAPGEELHDTVGELEGLPRAGRSQNGRVGQGAHRAASWSALRTVPRRVGSRYWSALRRLNASRTG